MITTNIINRDLLAVAFPQQPRIQRAFEDQAIAVADTVNATVQAVEATEALQDATYLTLSANTALANERVLALGGGLSGLTETGRFTLSLNSTVARVSGPYSVSFVPDGDCTLFLPLTGTLATRAGVEVLSNKTLTSPKVSGIGDYADDAAAALGGVPVGGIYRTASALKVRVA